MVMMLDKLKDALEADDQQATPVDGVDVVAPAPVGTRNIQLDPPIPPLLVRPADHPLLSNYTPTQPPPTPAPLGPPPGTYPAPYAGEGANTNYNNIPALNQLRDIARNSGSSNSADNHRDGIGLSNILGLGSHGGGGTLRNILGTLGDAFLISSGHQPTHAGSNQREQIAEAAAGFEQDPGAAAGRIAATGAPGSMQDAQTMYTGLQNEQLRQAQLQANIQNRQAMAQNREDVLNERADNHKATQGIAKSKEDDRTRAYIGGLMQSAVASGDQAKYDRARKLALQFGAKMDDFNPDTDAPADMNDYAAGYGLNAAQVTRHQDTEASRDQRGDIAARSDATRRRGQDLGVQNTNTRTQATYAGQGMSRAGQLKALQDKQDAGQPLTPAEQAIWNHDTHVSAGRGGGLRLAIPGLTNTPAAPAPAGGQSHFSQVHTYPSGRKAGWNGKQWVAIN